MVGVVGSPTSMHALPFPPCNMALGEAGLGGSLPPSPAVLGEAGPKWGLFSLKLPATTCLLEAAAVSCLPCLCLPNPPLTHTPHTWRRRRRMEVEEGGESGEERWSVHLLWGRGEEGREEEEQKTNSCCQPALFSPSPVYPTTICAMYALSSFSPSHILSPLFLPLFPSPLFLTPGVLFHFYMYIPFLFPFCIIIPLCDGDVVIMPLAFVGQTSSRLFLAEVVAVLAFGEWGRFGEENWRRTMSCLPQLLLSYFSTYYLLQKKKEEGRRKGGLGRRREEEGENGGWRQGGRGRGREAFALSQFKV